MSDRTRCVGHREDINPVGDDVAMSAPARFGRYRVDRRLGSGAFATVWLGFDEELHAPVAVKVLADNWAHHLDVRERFLEEARILRRADSDRVVRVHDIGELDDGRPYFVMTYADRGTLADRLASGPLPVPQALRYGADIALGVAVLHEVGVIHRDLTPANVLLRSSRAGAAEQVLVADLGLAKAAAQASGFTLSVGTPGYMAPEQARPEDGLDQRADVYAIGALVTAMLTGAPPPADGTVAARLPPGIRPLLSKAMAVRPADRYGSAEQLAIALVTAEQTGAEDAVPGAADAAGGPGPVSRESLEDTLTLKLPIEVRPDPDPAEPLPAPPRRRWRRRVLWTVAALLVVGGLGGGGVAAAVVLRDRSTVTVTDSSHTLQVTVPARWVGQVQDSGWDLAPYGKPGRRGAGLAVAKDVATWRDPSSSTPGVFVGQASGMDKEMVLSRSAAKACGVPQVQSWQRFGRTGEVRRYPACTGSPVHFVEGVLQASGSPGEIVYVQIREPIDSNDAQKVLESFNLL
jgi:eukaryotic-like serine/threonine-protein kinase